MADIQYSSAQPANKGRRCSFAEHNYPYTNALQKTSILLQRIILSNWMLILAFLQRDFNSLKLRNLADDRVDARASARTLNDLMSSRTLLNKCCAWAKKDAMQLGIDPNNTLYFSAWQEPGKNDRDLLSCDWAFLVQELQTWRKGTETLLNNQMTHLQVLDSKRARTDSLKVNSLNKLGQLVVLIFTPLSCTYGIRSMNDDFAPGNPQFWVFWTYGSPLVRLTILLFIGYRWIDRAKNQTSTGMLDVEKG